MSRMPERRPSVILSHDLDVAMTGEASCRVLPLPRRSSEAFDTLDAQFFAQGDTLGYVVGGADFADEPPPRRAAWLARRRLLWAAPAVAVAVGFLGAWHFHRPASPAPAAMPAAPALAPPPAPAAVAVAQAVPAEPALPAPVAPAPPAPAAAVPVAAPAAAAADDAIAECKQAHARHQRRQALALCEHALDGHPDSADVATILAELEFDRARFAPALTWARKAIALDEQRAAAYVFLGGAEQALGHAAAARAAYRRYLELDPHGRHAADVRAVLASL
jgi:tetratricopeptide (TPR) repeat protein